MRHFSNTIPGGERPKTIASPDECRRSRVRTRLAAGGNRIRTTGSARPPSEPWRLDLLRPRIFRCRYSAVRVPRSSGVPVVGEGPMVRIHFPPAASRVRTRPLWAGVWDQTRPGRVRREVVRKRASPSRPRRTVELRPIFDGLHEFAINSTKPVTANDIAQTGRHVRELTKIGES
jgi:hypothetical protein